MGSLIEHLRSFNRKERFYVVAQALQDSTSFTLHPRFLARLEATFGIQIPSDYFAAMDYHLDWLYASLYLAAGNDPGSEHSIPDPKSQNEIEDKKTRTVVEGNQEDVDFLLAYGDDTETHLIILEAKGATGWTNGQMEPKARRLKEILTDDPAKEWRPIPELKVHFALWSPRDQRKLVTKGWPSWMTATTGIDEEGEQKQKPHWIRLVLPPRNRVTRCNPADPSSKSWTHWTVVDD